MGNECLRPPLQDFEPIVEHSPALQKLSTITITEHDTMHLNPN
jgi:hypothetical protein